MQSATVFPLTDAFKCSSGATHWLLQPPFTLQLQQQEENASPEVGRGGGSKADVLQLLSFAQKKNFCSTNWNLSVLQMAQQMQCSDENSVDSDAAKTLQAEAWLSCTEHLTHTATEMILGTFGEALS